MQPIHCEAALFDLDGVLVNSDTAIHQSWLDWAQLHDLDLDTVLAHAYGRRTRDTIAEVAPYLDADAESLRVTDIEFKYIPLSAAFEGALRLLEQLAARPHAVVTSGTRDLASARLRQCRLPVPLVFVTADVVTRGKPDPEGFLLAASQLGIEPRACAVIEDSPAGLQAAKAAGMQAIGVATTHDPAALTDADLVVDALRDLTLAVRGDSLEFSRQPHLSAESHD